MFGSEIMEGQTVSSDLHGQGLTLLDTAAAIAYLLWATCSRFKVLGRASHWMSSWVPVLVSWLLGKVLPLLVGGRTLCHTQGTGVALFPKI